MSRYYQSAYHGSNDYKKYRQERLKANNPKCQQSLRTSNNERTSYSPIKSNNHKEHLQTFGREDKISIYNKNSQLNVNFYGNQQRRNYSNKMTEKSKFDRYQGLKQNNQLQSDRENADLYALRSRSNSRFSQYEDQKLQIENFQDSVLSRRKQYTFQSTQMKDQPYQSLRSYDYCSKIDNLCRQKSQFQDRQNYNLTDFKKRGLISRKECVQNKDFVQPRNYQREFPQQSRIQKSPSYHSRNQLIKQRLNLNHNPQQGNFYDTQSKINKETEQNYQTSKETTYTSRYVTTHTTPQKSQTKRNQEKDLSEQRRKSLIEKSQILKQKLNKLNASSNKMNSNIKNQTDYTEFQNNTERQKINIQGQGYTPSKRYVSNNFNQNCQNQPSNQRFISKRLDFSQKEKQPQRERCYDPTLKESNQNIIFQKNYQNEKKQNPKIQTRNLQTKKCYQIQNSDDGALKKIQELNQRINSRLQSILKNYG